MNRALAIVAVLGMAAPAHAEEWVMAPPSLTPPVRPVQLVRQYYGHQTLLVDLASAGGIVAGIVTESPVPAVMGLLGFWLGAPAVHLSHGESGRALASFVMRPGLVIGGAYLGVQIEDCDGSGGGEFCGLAGIFFGSIVGLGVASVIDAAWSYEVTVAPIVHPRGESYGLGLTGSF
jgi:hypothetical protein